MTYFEHIKRTMSVIQVVILLIFYNPPPLSPSEGGIKKSKLFLPTAPTSYETHLGNENLID